ncbi:MAG: FHA domain-containing protein [Planctomycetota bacterium]
MEPSETTSRLFLAIFDDDLRRVPVEEGALIIGRSRDAHLRVKDALLSRKHCVLTRTGDRILLADLNSSNGTFVNGSQVASTTLACDDIIELGKAVLVLFDGEGWSRGDGLLNLRNPVKAQELVQRLREGGAGLASEAAPETTPRAGVRSRKGLSEEERGFLLWLEKVEREHLPELVGDYLTHKLISLLVRRSDRVRGAFTSVLEEMMDPAFFSRAASTEELRAEIRARVRDRLAAMPAEGRDPSPGQERDLLEPELDAPEGADDEIL